MMKRSANTELGSMLDYRFAWRWLLPLHQGDVLVTYGLTPEEQRWWQRDNFIASPGKEANGVLISVNSVSFDRVENSISRHSPDWVCAWGNGAEIRNLANRLLGFSAVRFYGLLPATMPRVVVPLSSSRALLAALRLHQPGRRIARAALWFASILVRVGCYRPLERQMLVIACRTRSVSPAELEQLGDATFRSARDFAMYLGGPEENRKTVVLPVPSEVGRKIIKTADNRLGRAALRNEAQALARMAETQLCHQVPVLSSFRDEGGKVSLVQEYRPRKAVRRRFLEQAVQGFLRTLATVDIGQTTLREFLARLPNEIQPEMTKLARWLTTLPPDTTILLHRSHGDCTPWNCSWTEQGLFVYDWEASQPNGFALSDAFYYVLAQLRFVRHIDNGKLALDAIKDFVLPLLQLNMQAEDLRLYIAVWLLEQSEVPLLYKNIAEVLLDIEFD